MLNQFKNYLSEKYPKSDITTPYSIGGNVYIRFELGDDLKNGTKKRVKQVVDRTTTIFNQEFKSETDKLWVVFYDYKDYQYESYNENRNHLFTLVKKPSINDFEIQEVLIQNGFFETNQEGESIPETESVKIGIGLFNKNEFDFVGLIEGIANLEMGFDPKITQTVMVFDTNSSKGFYMYDDRGCYVWSDNAASVQSIYEEFKDWIVDFDKETIDNFFN